MKTCLSAYDELDIEVRLTVLNMINYEPSLDPDIFEDGAIDVEVEVQSDKEQVF
jgi:hypothetical protein